MTNHIKPATESDVLSINAAVDQLRRARNLLANAGATKAAAATRRAIKSADGARRHVTHRVARTEKDSAHG